MRRNRYAWPADLSLWSLHHITCREKNLHNTNGQSRMICFAMSSTAHVQSHSHVFFVSVQNKTPERAIQLVLHPKESHGTGVPHLMGLWSVSSRQDAVSTKATRGATPRPQRWRVCLQWSELSFPQTHLWFNTFKKQTLPLTWFRWEITPSFVYSVAEAN